MKVEIIKKPFKLTIYGYSGTAVNKDYAGAAFKLMDKMWKIVKANEIKNKGMNIWVYEPGEKVFAGVELYEAPDPDMGLESKEIDLVKYAYYKHIGSYSLIKQAGQNMITELRSQGLQTVMPYIEIYGHWTNDETKQETGLLMALK
jgi:effector-binding domain-containing protein